MDIIERLRSVWPARFELQPKTSAERKNVIEIQMLKADSANEIERLRAFAQEVMEFWPMGDLDGGALQDAAIKHGLLVPETRHEPCGEACNCAGLVNENEWEMGVICYRKTPLLLGV